MTTEPVHSLRRNAIRLATVGALVATLAVVGASTNSAPTASANALDQGRVVSSDPVDNTPYTLNGQVNAIATIGDTVVVGGTFNAVRNAGIPTDISRPYLYSYNRVTGRIDTAFAPRLDDAVDAMEISPDGKAVVVGGKFRTVNGVTMRSLAKISLGDGRLVSGFDANVAGRIRDLDVAGGKVYIGGDIWSVRGQPRNRMAAVDVTTGAVDPTFTIGTTAPRVSVDWVSKIDVRPGGRELVIVGNFSEVDRVTRHQAAIIDLSGPTAQLAPWTGPAFNDTCSSSFWTYVRDVEYSPNGDYFAVATTGAPRGLLICDSLSRWESNGGPGSTATWIDWSGGDTLSAVAISDVAVYVGGHQRWLNNRRGSDNASSAAVSRAGIGAVDPLNGVPFSWNPGKDRGIAVFDLHLSPDGLFVGSDTDFTAGEYHPKLAQFPLAGGATVPIPTPAALPARIYTSSGGALSGRGWNGTTFGPSSTVDSTVIDWTGVGDAFEEAGRLYYVRNGRISYRTFDGSALGTEVTIPSWISYPSLRAAGWSNGSMYYVESGTNRLKANQLSLESGLVGSETQEFQTGAGGIDWRNVTGLDFVDGDMYFTMTDRNLRRMKMFGDLRPDFSSITIVSGPAAGDGLVWNTNVFAARSDSTAPPLPLTVTITAPSEGAVVAGTVDVVADVSGAATSASFSVDGTVIGTDTTPGDGWRATWDTSSTPNGPVEVAVQVADGAGMSAGDRIDVTVDNDAVPTVYTVVGNPGSLTQGEAAIVDRLGTLAEVVVADDGAVDLAAAAAAELVFVSSDANSNLLPAGVRDLTNPVWVTKPYYLDTMKMATTVGEAGGQTTVTIVAPGHPLAAGKSGDVVVLSPSSRLLWSTPGAGATVVATSVGQPSTYVYEAGAPLVDSTPAPGCRLSSSALRSAPLRSTAAGWELFDAVATYGVAGCAGG